MTPIARKFNEFLIKSSNKETYQPQNFSMITVARSLGDASLVAKIPSRRCCDSLRLIDKTMIFTLYLKKEMQYPNALGKLYI